MRKIFWGLFLSLTLLVCTAYAEGQTLYTLDEMGITLSVPDRYVTITRDVQEGDEALAAYGMTRDEVLYYMEENHFYLTGYDPTRDQELLVMGKKNSGENLNDLSDEYLQLILDEFEKSLSLDHAEALSLNMVQLGGTRWMEALVKVSDGSYTLQYYTIYNYQQIYVSLYAYSGPIAEEEQQLLRDVVESVQFSGSNPAAGTGSGLWKLVGVLLVFCVPVLVYRYALRRRPMDPLWAVLLMGVYGLAGMAVAALLFREFSLAATSTVLVCSMGLYCLLVCGLPARKKETAPAPMAWQAPPSAPTAPPVPAPQPYAHAAPPTGGAGAVRTARYCDRCGNQLEPNARFCGRCGAEISQMIPPNS